MTRLLATLCCVLAAISIRADQPLARVGSFVALPASSAEKCRAFSLPVETPLGGDPIVPVLVIAQPAGDSPLRTAPMGAALVGYVGRFDRAVAHELLGDREIVPVALDPANPFPGSAIAYQSLDLVVLSSPASAIQDDQALETLLSAGVTIAVRQARKPDDRWPWTATREGWALKPVGSRADRSQAWVPPGRDESSRFRAVLAGVLVSCALVGASLLPVRFAIVCVALVSLAGAMGVEWYRRALPEIASGSRVARLESAGLLRTDTLTTFTARDSGAASVPVDGFTLPLIPDMAFVDRTGARLLCNERGAPLEYRLVLAAGESVTFVRRTTRPATQGSLR